MRSYYIIIHRVIERNISVSYFVYYNIGTMNTWETDGGSGID